MATSIMSHQVNGIEFRDDTDPTGANQETAQLVYRKPDGSAVTTGVFVFLHGGQKLRIYRRAADAGASDFFELDSGGRVVVQEA
jgi:hypothetical protein